MSHEGIAAAVALKHRMGKQAASVVSRFTTFVSNEPPASPQLGDVWYNPSLDPSGSPDGGGGTMTVISSTEPGTPIAGMLWVEP